jgi:small subunit ribosomal protein S6e
MANFKVVVSDPKSRKAFQKEIEQKASGLMGKRIGEKVKGDAIGIAGYELQITGGSDAQGFPMRRDVEGIGRKRLLLSIGPGFHPGLRGQRKRKSVRGNTVSAAISQINVKVVGYGSKPLEQLIGAPKEKREKPKEEDKKEELRKELTSKLDDRPPEKSRSEQILEEQAGKEEAKSGEGGKAEPEKAEGEAEPGKEESSEKKEQPAKAEKEGEAEKATKEESEKPEGTEKEPEAKPKEGK